MVNVRIALLGVSLGLAGMAAQAEPLCDCSKIVGQCAASIKMKSLSGSKPSFTANYTITSTTASCSKVSYNIDGTPYFNILAGTNSVEESTFGTEPISMKNFSALRCEVCASAANQQGNEGARPPSVNQIDPRIARFVGSWRGTLKWMLFSDPVTIELEVRQGRLTGRVIGKSGTSEFTSVTVHGNSITYGFIGMDGGTYSYTMALQSEHSAKVTSNGSLSFDGVVRRSN